MKVVVTGSQGFIGKNLCIFLREQQHEVLEVHRETPRSDILSYMQQADFVFHLAGINRPSDPTQFHLGNVDLTRFIVEGLSDSNRGVPLVLTSSSQAEDDNDYGVSKLAAENIVQSYSVTTGAASHIYRLPNVFGKWCKPNYNSFVATFCNNALNGIDILVHDPSAPVRLVYIDDVCASFLELLDGKATSGFHKIPVEFNTTVGEVANIISSFKSSHTTLITERVGAELTRALYSTYLSYTPPDQFNYSVPSYADERGVFVEILKTRDCGQFSFFTALPGITRGGHYHHTKTEKFLVIKGSARFRFRNILTNDKHSINVSGQIPEIVETVPGWAHDICNVGDDELIVMLWANEIFDRDRPDTIASEV
jgi:UDP-2-acetamido-2,6-beta-L-arabino-hexul-4-ose reductase